jgi:endogenous inhibitor of DNA gyrase (YacG/DUF329 family)
MTTPAITAACPRCGATGPWLPGRTMCTHCCALVEVNIAVRPAWQNVRSRTVAERRAYDRERKRRYRARQAAV